MISNLTRCAAVSFLLGACTPPTPPAQEPAPPAPPPTSAPSVEVPAAGTGGGVSSGGSPSTAGSAAGGSPAAPREKMCGGIAGIQCPAKQYCSFAPEAHCGAADMSGTCAPKPDACTMQLDEVCGCDDKTYGNACAAAQAGVSIVGKGPCAKPAKPAPSGDTLAEGALCGTRGVSKQCAPDAYCAYKSDCGATDAGGKCTKRPTMCTKIYSPTCGCDGKTYASGCTAASAGTAVAHPGACKP